MLGTGRAPICRGYPSDAARAQNGSSAPHRQRSRERIPRESGPERRRAQRRRAQRRVASNLREAPFGISIVERIPLADPMFPQRTRDEHQATPATLAFVAQFHAALFGCRHLDRRAALAVRNHPWRPRIGGSVGCFTKVTRPQPLGMAPPILRKV